jgi:beta-lactamase class A
MGDRAPKRKTDNPAGRRFRRLTGRAAPRRGAAIGVVWVLCLVLASCGGVGSGGRNVADVVTSQTPLIPTSLPSPSPTFQPTEIPTATEDIPAAFTAEESPLSRAIDKLVKDEQGVYGIVVMRPNGAVEYQRNTDTPFVAASLYKLVLLADVYRRRDDGEIAFDQQLELLPEYFPSPGDLPDGYYDQSAIGGWANIDELVFATGAYSSNVAAKALLSLTDAASLNRMAVDLGLDHTHLLAEPQHLPSWPPSPGPDAPAGDEQEAINFVDDSASDGPISITTPGDMARFFRLLLAGRVVNADVSAGILDILKQQMVDDRFPYLLPKPTDMAHKTGNVDHVVHDVGVIWTPDGPVILAAMIEDPPDDDHATQIIQRLALIAYGTDDVPPFTERAVKEDPTPEDDSAGDG